LNKSAVIAAASAAALLAFVPAAYAQCGGASWYGPGFNGKRAASGEIFNENAMTAAHRSLPFGTVVEVTDQRTGKTVEVTINDRGPFHGQRIIDLSKGAAAALGFQARGTTSVCIAQQYSRPRRTVGRPPRWAALFCLELFGRTRRDLIDMGPFDAHVGKQPIVEMVEFTTGDVAQLPGAQAASEIIQHIDLLFRHSRSRCAKWRMLHFWLDTGCGAVAPCNRLPLQLRFGRSLRYGQDRNGLFRNAKWVLVGTTCGFSSMWRGWAA
jgi:rare lipoprotein A